MDIRADSNFSITIDFDKDSPNPSRIFESMSLLIKAFEQLDSDLVKHLDGKIEAVLLLEDVEKGSLKTLLSSLIRGIPDEALEDGSIKKLIGHYLLKAKYIILNKMEGKATVSDAQEIEDIEILLGRAAEETGVVRLPTYVKPSRRVIIKHIDSINKSLLPLSPNDSAYYVSAYGKAGFNMDLTIDYDSMEDLITNETIVSTSTMILKVKKPDYLGESQWTFKHGNSTVTAKISDAAWLGDFQNRRIDVRPQDSLVCQVQTTAKYDAQYELISNTFDIVSVIRVNPRPEDNQMGLYRDTE